MERLKDALRLSNCDAVIIPTELSCYYFTGFLSDYCYLIATRDFIRYYTDRRYYYEAKSKLNIEVVLIDNNNALNIISSDLKPYKTIGIDDTYLYHISYLKLFNAINNESTVSISSIVQDIKAVKNDTELKIINTAVHIADMAYQEILTKIRKGITEKQLAALIDCAMINNGADRAAFKTIVAFSENSAYPHWDSGERELRVGDSILMDYGASYKGYNSDMTRVISYGKPDGRLQEIYDIVLTANEKAESEITSGMTSGQADAISREYIDSFGYKEQFTHSLGHGIGMEVHEYPRLSHHGEAQLVNGMVFTIEPGIYIEGSYGVRIEDTVALIDDKVTRLTSSAKQLINLL